MGNFDYSCSDHELQGINVADDIEEETPNCNIFNMLLQLPLLNCDDIINSSPVSVPSFPADPFLMMNLAAHMDMDMDMVVPQMSEIESLHFSVSDQYYNQNQLVHDEPYFWQIPPATYINHMPAAHHHHHQNWGVVAKVEETGDIPQKVQQCRRYSVEERKARILRYLKKRNRRNFNKRIKYACRKTLADKRVRVRGRFVKKSNEPDHDHDHDYHPDHSNSNFQMMRYEEEDDWLQAAMADIEHLPYLDT